MSDRDEFAKAALTGWLASFGDAPPPGDIGEIARFCYELADAMIEARCDPRVGPMRGAISNLIQAASGLLVGDGENQVSCEGGVMSLRDYARESIDRVSALICGENLK